MIIFPCLHCAVLETISKWKKECEEAQGAAFSQNDVALYYVGLANGLGKIVGESAALASAEGCVEEFHATYNAGVSEGVIAQR